VLVPNTELGHLVVDGKDAEQSCLGPRADCQRLIVESLAKRVDHYLDYIERLLWPDLIIIGGGASKHGERFIPLLTVHAEVVRRNC